MWVQEGFDSKENEDERKDNSLSFSGIYSLSRSRSKQSVTTIGIPMNSKPSPPPIKPENQTQNINDPYAETENKQRETTPVSLKTIQTPVSPAQFLENMGQDFNSKSKYDINKFDIPTQPIFVTDNIQTSLSDDQMKEMKEMKEIEFDEASKQKQLSNDEIELNHYVPTLFDGLDIEKEFEWEQCIEFTKQINSLLIVELYSKVFGPSDVMFPFIDEILNKTKKEKNKYVKFIRLSDHKINEIQQIKQIINKHFSTPIPTYIFIKNGTKIDELKGAQPTQFEQLIDKHLKKKLIRPQSAPVKYTSILTHSDFDVNQFQTTQ